MGGTVCDAAGSAPAPRERFLNATEAGVYLGVHVETVVRAVHAGRLPAIRLKRTYRIRESDLAQVVAAREANLREQGGPAPARGPASLSAARVELRRCQGALVRALAHLERAG